MKPNTETVRTHLRTTGHISPAEARIVHNIERLAPRIQELRDDGMAIDTQRVPDEAGNLYTRYEFPSCLGKAPRYELPGLRNAAPAA